MITGVLNAPFTAWFGQVGTSFVLFYFFKKIVPLSQMALAIFRSKPSMPTDMSLGSATDVTGFIVAGGINADPVAVGLALLCGALLAQFSGGLRAEDTRLNIVMLMVDGLGYETIGAYGGIEFGPGGHPRVAEVGR